MGPWLLLLILALIAFVLGFVVAAKWLFIDQRKADLKQAGEKVKDAFKH